MRRTVLIAAIVLVLAGIGAAAYWWPAGLARAAVTRAVEESFAGLRQAGWARAEHGKVEVDTAARRLVVHDIVLERRDAPATLLTIRRLEGRGIDPDAVGALFGPARPGGAPEALRVAESLSFSDIDLSAADSGLRIAAYTIEGAQLVSPGDAPGASWIGRLRYDRGLAEGVEMRHPLPGSGLPRPATLHLARVETVGFDGGWTDRLLAEGAELRLGHEKPPVELTAGVVEARDLDFSTLLAAGNGPAADGPANQAVRFGMLALRGVGGPTLAPYGMRIGELRMAMGEAGDGSRTDTLDARGIEIDRARIRDPELAEAAAALSYERLVLELGLRAISDRQAGTMQVERLVLKGPSAGELSIGLKLENVADDPGATLLGLLRGVAGEGRLAAGRLSYRDDGLAEKLLSAVARKWDLDPAALRQQLAELAEQFILDIDDSPGFAAMADEVAAFVIRPRAIQLELKPEQPIPLGELEWLPSPQFAKRARLTVTSELP